MKKLLLPLFLMLAHYAGYFTPQTWYVRADGGTRLSANVPAGQCDGLSDLPASGAVSNHCAFNDVRYLWDDDSGLDYHTAVFWVIAGGDTVVIRGCHALAAQVNPANPTCRIGWDNGSGGGAGNLWCTNEGNTICFNPPIPAGTSGNHTKILGACAFGTYTCSPVTSYPVPGNNLTQLFGGFGLSWTFNLSATQYVDIEGIELTTHNGVCTNGGQPAYPRQCNVNPTIDDYAQNGFLTSNTTANILLQDVSVHGFNSGGINGPIGGPVTMTRIGVNFNGQAGWQFANIADDANGAGSGITATNVTMNGNGCYEEYPVVDAFPAQACYDSDSNGFGDSWSGQDSLMDFFTCVHCVMEYNTKDGFIGPHTQIGALAISQSVSIGNMGAQWKWGSEISGTVDFHNNLTVTNCSRMAEQLPGASKSFGSIFITSGTAAGSTVTFQTSTQSFVAGDTVAFFNFNGSGAYLSNQSATVLSAGLSSTQFEAVVTSAASFTDNGNTQETTAGKGGGYLSLYCRANNGLSINARATGTYNYYGNTVVAANNVVFDLNCGYSDASGFHQETNCNTSPFVFTDNAFHGYSPPFLGTPPPGQWFFDPSAGTLVLTSSHNNYFGVRAISPDVCGTGSITCNDSLFVNEPSQTWTNEAALDVFNPFAGSANSFYPSSGSPLLGAGAALGGLTTDYYGTTRPNPPAIGGAELPALTNPFIKFTGKFSMTGRSKAIP